MNRGYPPDLTLPCQLRIGAGILLNPPHDYFKFLLRLTMQPFFSSLITIIAFVIFCMHKPGKG